jgi:segregation and condensation protein A
MADYRVDLDVFAGPLDLLLYLVRKEEVDIYDIHIAKITDQYIRYIEMLKSLDIDLAGDFLVMAATLMQIKSAMLLPKAEPDQLADDDLSDPRTELIRQLLEYKKFKDAANRLNAAADEQKERFGRPGTIVENLKPDAEPEVDIEQVSIWDLLEAFDLVCKAIGNVGDISQIKDDTPIDLYQIEILHRLQTEGPMTFERVFESKTNRFVMIGLFLAMLELIREKLIWAEQSADSTIYVRPLTDEPAEQAVQEAILATEADYDDSEVEQTEQPPIPIAELPSKGKASAPLDSQQPQEQPAIPIAELPPENKPVIVPQEQEQTGRTP